MNVKFLPIKRQLTALAALLVGFPALLSLVGMYVAPHDIKGVVYRDFDANGTRQTTTTYAEPGVPGVTVTAYAADGTQAAQTTTGADGTYTLDIPAAGNYRVEFTGLQAGDFSGAFGTGSGTSVQFVSGGAENVNLGINYPAQYSSSKNPRVLTSGFVAGNPDGGHTGHTSPILWTLPFSANGNQTAASGTSRGDISQSKDLGAVWGLAYAKRSKTAYVAAFTKRHVGFGPGGAGAIYKVSLANQTAASVPQLYYQFPDAAVGTGIHGTLNDSPGEATRDNEAFDNVGKTSLGDIDISDDDKSLYVISLADRKLNVIDLTGDPVATPVSYSIPGPEGETWRPFAVKYYRGKVYVGVTVTNENSYASNSATNKGNSAGMRGIVYEFDGTSFTQVLLFPLDGKKQPTNADLSAGNVPSTAPAENAHERGHYWRPWTAVYRYDREPATSGASRLVTYAQPWLTDIEFDVNGEMILGIRDRWGDQIGYQNYLPDGSVGPGGPASYSAIAPGQVLRAGKVSLAGSEWQIESRGTVTHLGVTTTASTDQKRQFGPGGAGGITYASTSPAVNVNSTTYFNRIVNGGVEGKYYWGDIVGVGGNHGSSALGGLALLPGSGKLIMTAMDPTDLFNTGGLRRLHNGNGFINNRGVEATAGAADDNQNNTSGNTEGVGGASENGTYKGAVIFSAGVINWGKANGMGEVELLTDPAPIEIGNRIWRDADSDGIQDAGEAGIAGVTVELVDEAGTVVATAVTDAGGNYIFSSDPTRTSAEGDPYIYNLPLVYGAKYKVRVPNIDGASKQAALGTDHLTQANQGEGNPNGDERDSDGEAVENESYAETALFTLGDAGENDHSYDFGFAPLGALGDYVWIDTNSDGIQDPDEEGVNGVTVTLYKWNPDTEEYEVYGTPQQTVNNPNESGKKGYYWFDNLPSGQYQVGFSDLPDGYVLTDANQGSDDAEDSDADVNGRSHAVIIDTSKPLDDLERINPTIDAGIVPVGSIGDYVWYDTDKDGEQDDDESGVNGVEVELYKWVGDEDTGEFVLEATTTTAHNSDTDKDGYYHFPNLRSGKYKVKFIKETLPSGYEFTHQDKSDVDDDKDSDADRTTGETGDIDIDTSLPVNNIGRNNPTIDAGLVPVGSLPVKLAQFDAVKEGATAKLTWKTTSEVNASHFEVQRSIDARTWVKIGTVAAIGSENTTEHYTFTDGSPVRGVNFYRLRTVDTDGTSEGSRVVSLDFAKGSPEAAFVYPNPASESIRFSNSIDLSRVKNVSVVDTRGIVVYTAGSLTAEGIPATRFREGLYVIRLRLDDGTTRDFKVVIAPKK